jgi:hypothetical protein
MKRYKTSYEGQTGSGYFKNLSHEIFIVSSAYQYEQAHAFKIDSLASLQVNCKLRNNKKRQSKKSKAEQNVQCINRV